jgi:hypothetical protein
MKHILYIFTLLSISGYGQIKIDKLINQVANDVVPEAFNYYYLLENSLQDEKANDSINLTFPNGKREFLKSFPNFPFDLGLKVKSEKINWKNYNLEKVKYITEVQAEKITRTTKEIYFVDENIEKDKYDYLNENKELNSLIVRKNKRWNDIEIWNEVEKAFKEDAEFQNEKKVYYVFSNPIFSKDNQYARITVLLNRRCKGSCTTYIYQYKDEEWTQIKEYGIYKLKAYITDIQGTCEDLIADYKN